MLPYDSITKERNILTAAWKWRGERKTSSITIHPKRPADDKHIVKKLLDLFHEADAVVAHYGDKFDIRYVLTRSIFHGFPPPPNVQQIDTYKIAKNKFLFNSNRLDYLGKFLGVGRKIKTDVSLWDGCMEGNPSAIRKMEKYNKQDVELLSDVYEALAPYSHIKQKVLKTAPQCGNCGGRMTNQGTRKMANGVVYSRYQCKDCGRWGK